jgi:hypothetical protein
MSVPLERSPALGIALGAFLIGLGGLLLGLQIDADGAWCGTGLASLGPGALLALAAFAVRASPGRAPRDLLGATALAAGFLGLAFLIAGVLAPGGGWMFFEIALLVVVVALRRPDPESGQWIRRGALVLLGVFLLFRLWISYQGGRHRWELVSIDVPVLSWLPFEFLRPVQQVSLGSFTPNELGFPPAGLDFAPTSCLWALGFALALAGLWLVQAAALEHEDERVHGLIRTLPPALADAVERILPEEEWRGLGLHGLPPRRLARRIEALVAERARRLSALRSALDAPALRGQAGAEEFGSGIRRALLGEGPREGGTG